MFARKCSLLSIVPSQTRMMMMFGADATSTFWIYVKQISLVPAVDPLMEM